MSLKQNNSEKTSQNNPEIDIATGGFSKQPVAIIFSSQESSNPDIVACVPDSVSAATINQENLKYWSGK